MIGVTRYAAKEIKWYSDGRQNVYNNRNKEEKKEKHRAEIGRQKGSDKARINDGYYPIL